MHQRQRQQHKRAQPPERWGNSIGSWQFSIGGGTNITEDRQYGGTDGTTVRAAGGQATTAAIAVALRRAWQQTTQQGYNYLSY